MRFDKAHSQLNKKSKQTNKQNKQYNEIQQTNHLWAKLKSLQQQNKLINQASRN